MKWNCSGGTFQAVVSALQQMFNKGIGPDNITKDLYDLIYYSNIGKIEYFTRSTPPMFRVEANGALLSRAEWPDLWEYAQTSGNLVTEAEWAAGRYGSYTAGDGSTTFRVQDLRGRGIIGAGQGSGLTLRTLGEIGGEEKHPLTANENGLHTHMIRRKDGTSGAAALKPSYVTGDGGNGDISSDSSGLGTPHNNMQPWTAELVCIFAGRRIT